jgi:anti-sigma factor RsiW
MNESSPLDDRERADLVAYLDGELKGEAARKIEKRIAQDPVAREEAESLRRAWDMLDFLPLQEPSAQFTNRTVSKITPILRPSSPPAEMTRRPWTGRALVAGWAAAIGLAIAVGYGGTRVATPREPGEQELVRDLRVIENKRLYEVADDLDFVRDLDAPELFGEDAAGT